MSDEELTDPPTDNVVEEPIKIQDEPTGEEPENTLASKKDVDAVLDAVRELTKVVAENTKESTKWFRAGKMGGV